MLKVNVLFDADIIQANRGRTQDGRKIYTLYDVYPHADLVTYPSNYEGFGNAFLEAVYFRRPLLINNYSIYSHDIKPKGFRVVEIDDYIRDDTVREVARLFEDRSRIQEMVDFNYELGRRYYSYGTLKRRLTSIITEFFGEG
jgi:glycosyltransferase involved in cell wall biosynthesis